VGNRTLSVVLAALLVFSMALTGGAKPTVLKYATTGPGDPLSYIPYAAGLIMKQIIEARTEGQIIVEIYPGSALGTQREIIEGVQMETVEIGSVNTAGLSGWVEEMDLLSIPFLFRSERMAWEILDGPFGQKLMEHTLARTGLRIVGGIQTFGMRHLTNSVRPVRIPGDLKGLKFRSMDSPIFIKMFQALGATATPIAASEMYLAMQMGTVDGQENPPQSIDSFKLYEVQKYLTLDGHTVATQVMIMNDNFLKRLSREQRDIVLEAARDATISVRGFSILVNLIAVEKLTKQGMEVYQPSPEELDLFAAATQKPVLDHLSTYIDREWIQDALDAAEAARARLADDYMSFGM
jgi:tripartite ATP-independent transporter DctP family solute receptor